MDSSATSTPTPNPSQTPASANQQNTSTTSTGPQIRSRITVVCAECKRLKLKCDRKSPCGSCTKRDTVARCVYSPAAAEKVDLHSLNNRLIQVEAVLSMITAGHTPPAFQPAYPLSSSPSSTALPSLPAFPASGRHQHHHHYAAPPPHCSANDSITLSNHDITTIWLNDLDLGVSTPNTPCTTSMQHNSFTSGNSAGCIKLEPCNGDINLSLSNNDADTGTVFINIDGAQASSRSTLASRPVTPPQSNGHSRSSQLANLYLPPLSIYYPASLETSTGTSSFTFSNQPNGVPSVVSLNGPPTHPHPTKPQLTSELLALLPPLQTCRFLLQRAGDVFRVRPVPFESGAQKGWKEFEVQCIKLLNSESPEEKEKERLRKEKVREAKRARQIYFGGINGLQSLSEDAEMDESTASGQPNGKEPFDERRSLPFFASLSATLAVGAFVSSQSGSDTGSASSSNPAFLLALSQQALGVWDTHTTSFGSAHSVAYDTERLQYLLACFTGMQYLLLSWSRADKAEKTTISSQIQALVSRMVNLARGIGLGRENASSQKSKPTQSPSEVQESADGVSNATNLNRGASRKEKEAAKERARAEWKKKLLWEVMFYDLFTSDILEHQSYVPSYSYLTNTPICPDTLAQHSGSDCNSMTASSEVVNRSGSMPTGDEDAYLCSRYGLTKLAHAIKHQVNQPNCCCGYTYDQAAALEDRIRRWQSGLPVSLQTPLNASGITRSPSLHAQSCELAVMACLLIIKIYTPFLRINASPAVSASPSASPPSQSGNANASSGNPSTPNSANGSPISLAIHAAASAAQTIIRAVKVYRSLNGSNSVVPAIFDMYALDKIVFDSVIICTHAGMTNIASSLSFDGGAIMTDVASGIEMLRDMASLDDQHKNMLDVLSKRITNSHGSPNMLKRKHSSLGNSTQVSNVPLQEVPNGAVSNEGHDETSMVGIESLAPHNGGSQSQLYLHAGLPVSQQQQKRQRQSSDLEVTPQPFVPEQYGSLDRTQQNNRHNTQLLDALTPLPSRTSGSGEEKKDERKEKKQAKKTQAYPSLGLRLRTGKDGTPLQRSRTQSASTPERSSSLLPIGSATRPPPSAEAVLAYQMQQKQKMQALTSGTAGTSSEDGVVRPRSPSFSQGNYNPTQQRQRQLSETEFVPTFGPQQSQYVMGPQQQSFSPAESSFTSHTQQELSRGMYEQGQASYESAPIATGQASYNAVSSPFSNSNGPPSSSASPFNGGSSASSGHPPTPTVNANRPTPPVFGPQPGAPPPPPPSGAASYYPAPSHYNATGGYTTASASSSSLAHHSVPADSRMSRSSISESVLYDKSQHSQYSAAYDIKPNVNNRAHEQQQQLLDQTQQHMGHQSTGSGGMYEEQSGMSQLAMSMTVMSQQWPATQQQQQQQQQQQSQRTQSNQSFWNNGEGFGFYS